MMTLAKIMYILTANIFILNSNTFIKIIFLVVNMSISMFILNFFLKNNWFMLMFLLLMAGGLMVLFIYFTSSVKKMIFSSSLPLKLSIFLIPIMVMLTKKVTMSIFNSNNLIMSILNFYTNHSHGILMILLIVYVMIIMLVMIEMISSTKSPFRTLNK